jgi:hypothetical protein
MIPGSVLIHSLRPLLAVLLSSPRYCSSASASFGLCATTASAQDPSSTPTSWPNALKEALKRNRDLPTSKYGWHVMVSVFESFHFDKSPFDRIFDDFQFSSQLLPRTAFPQ